MEYLETHSEIANRIGRQITGIQSENSMKNVFIRLQARGMIEQIPGRKGFSSAWRKKVDSISNLDTTLIWQSLPCWTPFGSIRRVLRKAFLKVLNSARDLNTHFLRMVKYLELLRLIKCGGVVFILAFFAVVTVASPKNGEIILQQCEICGAEILGSTFVLTDKVTGSRYIACSECLKLFRCYICDLPVHDKDLKLPDGRRYCVRDAKSVVLTDAAIKKLCSKVRGDVSSELSRVMNFPVFVDFFSIDQDEANSGNRSSGSTTNVYERTDTLGLTRSGKIGSPILEKLGRKEDDLGENMQHQVSILNGRPSSEIKATCAHELGHTWVGENVSEKRRRKSHDSHFAMFENAHVLDKDAEEGFCELIAYLHMKSQGDTDQQNKILENNYTHGQTALFVEAEKRYGLNEVIDWMQYGETTRLEAGRLDKIREVKMPQKKIIPVEPPVLTIATQTNFPTSSVSDLIKLQGIIFGFRPVATINGKSFFTNDQLKIKIGESNVLIRCLEIQKNKVRVRYVDTGKEETLSL